MDQFGITSTSPIGVASNGSTDLGASRPTSLSSSNMSERHEVQNLLAEKRSSYRKSREGAEKFSYKEVNAVLSDLVEQNGSPNLVQAVLEHDADVNFSRRKSTNLFKRMFGKDQENCPNDILRKATESCSDATVALLASKASQPTKDDALLLAIQRNNASKVRALMAAGADATGLHYEFQDALRLAREDLVDAFFQGTKAPCGSCRTKGLIQAAETGSVRNVQILLAHGADAEHEEGAALQRAIRAGRADIADAIATCDRKPSPRSLDMAVASGYEIFLHDQGKQFQMLELCLKGGARGFHTDEALARASERGQTMLIQLLIAHGASVDHERGTAVMSAVTNGRTDHLASLVRGNPDRSVLANALKTAVKLSDFGIAKEATTIILQAGIRGDSVAIALVLAVMRFLKTEESQALQDLSLVRLLLEVGQADVNYDTGKSLQMASAAGSATLLKELLRARPLQESLDAAIPPAMNLQNSGVRLEVMDMILRAGPSPYALSKALVHSATTGKPGTSLTSMLLKYSSVNDEGGNSLRFAIRSVCMEQVEILMTGNPSSATVELAWIEADAVQDIEYQERVYQALLGSGVQDTLKNQSLAAAAGKGPSGYKICSLLLRNHASPNYQNGACVVSAARALDLRTLQLLANAATSTSVFDAAFTAVIRDESWICQIGLEIVHFLLEKGVSGDEIDVAFCQAAKVFSEEALELLVNSVDPDLAFTKAFIAVTGAGKEWLSDKNLWLSISLLEWGASGEFVHLALLEAVEAFCQGQASEDLIDKLLTVGDGADVNFQAGSAVRIAAQHGKIDLLAKLFSYGCTTETVSGALAVAIVSGHSEEYLLAIIDAIVSNPDVRLDVNLVPEGFSHPLFACLLAYPQSTALAERLCGLGCFLESEVEFLTYDDEDLPEENVTVLAWTLCQPQQLITSEVIDVLIEARANPNFVTRRSRVTPLILAVKSSRPDVAQKLLKAGASVSARDMFDRTALFYASRMGNLQSVKTLLQNKSPADDGSLHEAGRELHRDVVAILIKAKHSPDFPSSKDEHGGRTALQELCLKCDGSTDRFNIEATIKALVDAQASPLEKCRGKNALFLALDNPNPVPVTRALLDQVMWRYINDEHNVYIQSHPVTRINYYYSPTKYIEKGICLGPEDTWTTLFSLLVDKRAEPRYYAEEGMVQPEDAEGQPPAIVAAEKKRRTREEKIRQQEFDHQFSLLQIRNEAQEKAQIEEEKHQRDIFNKEETARQREEHRQRQHEQELLQANAKTQNQQYNQQSTHDLNAYLTEQREVQRAEGQSRRAAFERFQSQQMAQIKNNAIKEERSLKLLFDERANQEKLTQVARQNELSAIASRQRLQTQQHQENIRAAADKRKVALQARQNRMKLDFQRVSGNNNYWHQKQMNDLTERRQKMQIQGMRAKQNMRIDSK